MASVARAIRPSPTGSDQWAPLKREMTALDWILEKVSIWPGRLDIGLWACRYLVKGKNFLIQYQGESRQMRWHDKYEKDIR